MTSMETLETQRQRVLAELAEVGEMRRGTISEQFVETIGRDGIKRQRGPYFVYTYKEKGKTISRRLTSPEQVARCRKQIQAFRRFQELTARLLEMGERASNLALAGEEVKKTSRSRSKPKRTPK